MTLSPPDEISALAGRDEVLVVHRDERHPGVVRLHLNRPQVRNAINEEMREAFVRTLDELADEAGLRALLITAAGPYFCAGNDVTELDWLGSTTATRAEAAFRQHNGWLDRLSAFPLPVFAVVQGGALGHAAELVARCDVVACADDAVFGWPEVRAGGVPNSVWPLKLNHQGVVRECFYTGRLLDAAEARSFGLVNHVVAAARLADLVEAMAADLSLLSPYALRAAKSTVDAATAAGSQTYLDHALLVNALAHDAEHASGFWADAAEHGPKEANRRLRPAGQPYWSSTW
jgi:enoyl-CoA hydratase/carnithine racemase